MRSVPFDKLRALGNGTHTLEFDERRRDEAGNEPGSLTKDDILFRSLRFQLFAERTRGDIVGELLPTILCAMTPRNVDRIVPLLSATHVDEIKAYVKNQNLGFKVPYAYEGRPGNYYPDYILRVDDGHGMDDLLNLLVEISGQELQDKEAKVDTAAKLWVPAVNAEGTFGRWEFLEITDPWNAQSVIRRFLKTRRG